MAFLHLSKIFEDKVGGTSGAVCFKPKNMESAVAYIVALRNNASGIICCIRTINRIGKLPGGTQTCNLISSAIWTCEGWGPIDG
jgi:hypothetical protein